MTSKRGYLSCAVKTCKNNTKNCKFSFFRFPKNVERAKNWAIACHRSDLLSVASSLYNSGRICGYHFEKRMFLNDLKNRLHEHAIPKLNLLGDDEDISQNVADKRSDTVAETELSNISENTMNESIDISMIEADKSKSSENTMDERINISVIVVDSSKSLENTVNESIDISMMEVDSSKSSENLTNVSINASVAEVDDSKCCENTMDKTCGHGTDVVRTVSTDVDQSTSVENDSCVNTPSSSLHFDKSVQTKKVLSAYTLRNAKLLKENRKLRRQLFNTSSQLADPLQNINCKQFMTLCDKFLPTQAAMFVKQQVLQHCKTSQGRRFSAEFKKLCLMLYIKGPRMYRALASVFALPSRITLNRMMNSVHH